MTNLQKYLKENPLPGHPTCFENDPLAQAMLKHILENL